MTGRAAIVVLAVVVGAASSRAHAQPDPTQTVPDQAPDAPVAPSPTTPPTASAPPPPVVPGTDLGSGACAASEPAKPAAGAGTGTVTPPVAISAFEVTGELLDPPATVRALLAPTMAAHHALSDASRPEIAAAAAVYGYQVVGIETRETAGAVRAILHLAPLPIVRHVKINLHQKPWNAPLDDQVTRRMRLRAGLTLPGKPVDRECALLQEKARIEEYLRDEGFFRVTVKITHTISHNAATVNVDIHLGDEYKLGALTIEGAGALAVDEADIKRVFVHAGNCIVWKLCLGTARFNRSALSEDLQKVVELFHKRGYPSARVQSDFNRVTSPDHVTHRVNLRLTIDQRRHLDVQFEGNDPDTVTDEQLKHQLTFDKSGSSDDAEAADSAQAITAYLQGRGYFDAHVTWTRERFTDLDQIIYRITLGKSREVKDVQFVGNKALTGDALADVVSTKPSRLSRSIFGGNTAATSAGLADDIDRVVNAYREAGFREAQVSVAAATDLSALGDAAATAAFAAAQRGDGLYVRFAIAEGEPTLVTQVEVAMGPTGEPTLASTDDRGLCDDQLGKLAELVGDKQIAIRTAPDRCVAAASVAYREDALGKSADQLREWLWNHGRPRATVEFAATQSGPHQIVLHYKVRRLDRLKVGKIVIRGNFRTKSSIILGELQNDVDHRPLQEGAALTANALADAGRRLRATGLFDDVHVDLPDLETTDEDQVNGVVRVQERYDYWAQVDFEGGYSSLSGWYLKLIPSWKNIAGRGISVDLAGTIGTKIQAIESTLRFPHWLVRQKTGLDVQADLTAFYREQDTPQFGELTTEGVTLGVSRTWQRQRNAALPARSITLGFHYDYRVRNRQVDALRADDSDDDQTQVPVSTRTGSLGASFEWEQRVDRNGQLAPLAPERGFYIQANASFASPYLLGQDTFIKLAGALQKYWLVRKRVVVRFDLRYDQGIPLGGAVLLPEVERFFAGGDADVRGYNDDQLAHEIIQVGAPPFGTLSQIRVAPAGGNIRAMSSLDIQVPIYKVLASAVFSDVGTITNQWSTWTTSQLRPSVGMAFLRLVTPIGAFAFEYAIPLMPELGDDPRGRFHVSFAARGTF